MDWYSCYSSTNTTGTHPSSAQVVESFFKCNFQYSYNTDSNYEITPHML